MDITQLHDIIGSINTTCELVGTLSSSTCELVGEVSKASSAGYDTYKGDYEIVPKITSQTIYTEDKIMTENLSINPIPYYEVSNNSGQTIIIGGQ